MIQHDPEVFAVYQVDALRENFELAGVFSTRADAEELKAAIPADRHPCLVPDTMALLTARLREEVRQQCYDGLEYRLERLSERLGQLAAVVASKQVAA